MNTMTETWDEAALVQRAQKGNLDAFNALILHYQTQVYNLAWHLLHDGAAADDATQEAFISAYKGLAKFRGGSFRSWLLRIAANACYDELRRRKRRPSTSFDDFGDVDEDANPALVNGGEKPEEYAQRREMAHVLQVGIDTLPADQRITLVLSDVQGMNYQEIAETMEVSLGTVKSRLARARSKLRDYLR